MIRDADDLARGDIKAFAADTNKDAQRLNRMINDMLDLDRIEAGRLTLRLESVDINVVLQDAVERARASSERHTIEVKLDPSQPVPACEPDPVAHIVPHLLTTPVTTSPA